MLKINNLIVSYGVAPVIKDISFNIKEGSIVAFLGANGAGKTTTLNTISKLLKIISGSIKFKGIEISNFSPDKVVRMGISHVPEGREIFPGLTVEQNLKVGAYIVPNYNKLDSVYELFPILKGRRKQYAGTLSGGEQQMLAIGRGLMNDPKLLLLDEPSLGLAPIIIEIVFQKIIEINKMGTTILLVEQNANLALSISDYAYCLVTGKIVMEGKPEQLMTREDMLNVYLGGNL